MSVACTIVVEVTRSHHDDTDSNIEPLTQGFVDQLAAEGLLIENASLTCGARTPIQPTTGDTDPPPDSDEGTLDDGR